MNRLFWVLLVAAVVTVYGISTNAVHGREYTSTDRDILRGNNNETILDNAGTARTFRSAPKKPYKIQNSILSKLDYFIRPSVVPYIKETIPNIIRKAMEIMAYNSTLGIISLLSIISAVLGIGAVHGSMANHSDHGIRKSNRIVHNSRHRTAVNTEELFNEKATGQYWNSRKVKRNNAPYDIYKEVEDQQVRNASHKLQDVLELRNENDLNFLLNIKNQTNKNRPVPVNRHRRGIFDYLLNKLLEQIANLVEYYAAESISSIVNYLYRHLSNINLIGDLGVWVALFTGIGIKSTVINGILLAALNGICTIFSATFNTIVAPYVSPERIISYYSQVVTFIDEHYGIINVYYSLLEMVDKLISISFGYVLIFHFNIGFLYNIYYFLVRVCGTTYLIASNNNKMKENEKDDQKVPGMNLGSLMYSVIKRASVIGVIYLAGYMHWSVAWFITPVLLLVVRDQMRADADRRRDIAKTSALSNEKDVILARIDDLPAWVYFPDVERVEWLNTIIKQCWPNVNHYAREMVRDKIQPTLAKNLNKMKLTGFKFDRIILGSVPPRIGGVKVYDKNISRNEIIMDIDIFYAGDCDITFTLQGIKGGVRDFQLHGMLRVIMKPLITTVPIVGGLQVFFLNNPSLDFNLVGIADILDMPGLSDVLRRIIIEQIASMMVLPNKLPIKLSDIVEAAELKVPEPEGVLRVHVVEAKNLMKKDIGMLGKGKSDPYAIITVGAQEFRTKTIQNTVDPKWDFWCEFDILQSSGQQLYVHLWDFDDTSDDEALGRATVEVSNIVKKGQDNMWITLEQAKHGMIHLRLTWLTLSSNYADLQAALTETQYLRVTSMSTALLVVFVDSAKNLPQARSTSQPDPFAVFTLYKDSKQTAVQMRTSDPVWEQGFTFLVRNPETDTFFIRIEDQKTNSELGNLDINLNTLSDKANLEIVKQPFMLLKSGPQSKIILTLRLRILKNGSDDMQSDQPESPLEKGDSISSNIVSGKRKLTISKNVNF
ncbi:C2 domain [Popillia japonica]|uniref:C2 domain n=1 Tax=Popillia japonica TaxID=7064 RepID=A0AAW1ITZ6_POPJA